MTDTYGHEWVCQRCGRTLKALGKDGFDPCSGGIDGITEHVTARLRRESGYVSPMHGLLMREAADLLAALPPVPQTEQKAGELRNIVAHPFYVMALQFGWPDEQVKAARDLVDITIIRLEEWASALPPVRAEQEKP